MRQYEGFCEVCHHQVLDVARHIGTVEHRRQVKRGEGALRLSEPRLPGQLKTGSDIAPFPGRLRLGHKGGW